MTEVLLFHHAQGLTQGVHAFADGLRQAGHVVHTPDLFGGRIFESLQAGLAHIDGVGFGALADRGVAAADGLAADIVYAGFSFGAMPAQRLAQTRPGARGALLFHSCLPVSGEWAIGPWPSALPVQIHGMDNDPIFVGEGDIRSAREIVATAGDAELFLYPGDRHLFADGSLPSYDAAAAALLSERALAFLERVGR